MTDGQFQVRLKPLHGGAFTQLQLCGSVPTNVPRQQIEMLIAALAYWSGWPVELALPAEKAEAAWFDWWSEALHTVPDRLLRVRYERPNQVHRKHKGAAERG